MAPGTPLPLREGATPSRTYMYPHSALCASVKPMVSFRCLHITTVQLYHRPLNSYQKFFKLKIPCLYIINKLLLHVYRVSEGYIEIITYNYILKNLLIGIQRTDRLPLDITSLPFRHPTPLNIFAVYQSLHSRKD